MDSLNSNLFPTITNFSDQRTPYESPTSARHSLPSTPTASNNNTQPELGHFRSSTPATRRVSTFDPIRPSRNVSLAAAVASKSSKRQSVIGVPPTGRLFKFLGDLFLLAGRGADAGVW
jgi:trafficking protein particle complex subunit 9